MANGTPNQSGQNDEFALKSFVTRKRSLARRSIQGPPKGLFNLSTSGINEGSVSNNPASSSPNATPTKNKRPISILSGNFENGQNTNQGARARPTSMISLQGGQRNPFKIDLMLENDGVTTSIANSSNAQSFNQNVLRNNFSSVDKKIFNTPQMLYSPELNQRNPSQTLNLGPNLNMGSSTQGNQFAEKKFNLGTGDNASDLEYKTNIRSIHRQFNVNKFNVSLKTDLFKDVKEGKKDYIIKSFNKIEESYISNSKTPIIGHFKNDEEVDWEFWRSVIDHYPTKMSNVRSLKKIETKFSESGVPSQIRALIYLYLTNSKTATLEKIYKENNVISFFSKENDLRLRICETFNTDLRCLKSDQDLFSIEDLNKELLQKVDKDLFEVLRNFTMYYDRGGYSEIKGLLNLSRTGDNASESCVGGERSFYLPSKAIVSICSLLLNTMGAEEGVLDIKNGNAKFTKPEIFSFLIMLNENYFNFDNNINASNLKILKERKKKTSTADKAAAIVANYNISAGSSRRSSMTIDSALVSKPGSPGKEFELNNIKNNYVSSYNKDKFIYIFNRSLEDLFPEVFLYLSSRGIHTNIILERFIFEFFHRFSESYRLYDDENHDENNLSNGKEAKNSTNAAANTNIKINDIELNNREFETIRASVNDLSLDSIGEIKGDLNEEMNNQFFQNGYKLSNENLLRILDMILIQGVEFLIKFLLLVIEKNYFKIFKIRNNQVLMKFLSSNVVFNFLRDEDFKFVSKTIYESEIGQYQDINSFVQPGAGLLDKLDENDDSEQKLDDDDEDEDEGETTIDIKSISKNNTVRSDLKNSADSSKNSDKLINITIKEKKTFGDFIVEALKFEPVIYKYEEELKLLEKEKLDKEKKLESRGFTGTGLSPATIPGGAGTGIYKNSKANVSASSFGSTLTYEEDETLSSAFSRNSSRSSLSTTEDESITPELVELRAEKKDNRVRLMKLQTDLNNLTLTHKTYKSEILLKNEKLNKIKSINMELKFAKEELSKKVNNLRLKQELYHSVLKNIEIEKMNEGVKNQIEHVANDIRITIEKCDLLKDECDMMKEAHKSVEKPQEAKSGGFFGSFGWK